LSQGGSGDAQSFRDLHAYLREQFPRVHQTLRVETVGELSLLYTWQGTDTTLRPAVLVAHMDVVPAEGETPWTHPPFEGIVADGYIWGRGTLDNKMAVVGLLQAVEILLAQGKEPRRTLYLAFGHDEEVGGQQGAGRIVTLLKQRGVVPDFVLDEGMAITEGILEGAPGPVAFVGVAEKGYMNVQLKALGGGGHSAIPPRPTSAGRLGKALAALEESPYPAALDGVARSTLEFTAPEMSLGRRLILANLWLFSPLVERAMDRKPSTGALIRSTLAPTLLSGSTKENVLAQESRAVINVRLKPGDSPEDVLNHIRDTIDDSKVEVSTLGHPIPASRLSSTETPAFRALMESIRQIDPSAIVVPGLVLSSTDSKHYAELGSDVYRFAPIRLRSEDLPRVHGVDERISIEQFSELVRFYVVFLQKAGA
jgi:carboxypeptidase PM20D1